MLLSKIIRISLFHKEAKFSHHPFGSGMDFLSVI